MLTKARRSDPLVTLTPWTHCSQVVIGSLLWLGQFWWHAFLRFSWHCAGFDAEFPEVQSASVQPGPGESSLEPTSSRSTASGWLFICCCWWRCKHFWVWTDMPLLKQTEPIIKFVTCAFPLIVSHCLQNWSSTPRWNIDTVPERLGRKTDDTYLCKMSPGSWVPLLCEFQTHCDYNQEKQFIVTLRAWIHHHTGLFCLSRVK